MVEQLLDNKGLETDLLKVEKPTLYDNLIIQVIMKTNDGRYFVNGYGPGYRRRKYNLAVATQIGCRVRCKKICDVPKYRRDLSPDEISDQIVLLIKTAERAGLTHDNLKISMVKEGEPLLNRTLPETLETLADRFSLPIKVSTAFPYSRRSLRNIDELLGFAVNYSQTVQLQISLGSTDTKYRHRLTVHPTAPFELIRDIGEEWDVRADNGRKINLSFTLYEETPCDPKDIIRILPPEYFAIRLRDALKGKATPHDRNQISERRFYSIRDSFRKYGYKMIEGRPGDTERDNNLATGQYGIVRLLER